MKSLLALVVLVTTAAHAESRVTIEKATVPFDDLVNLIRQEGRAPPAKVPANNAPITYSLPTVDVTGSIEDGVARLSLQLEVEVLANRWTMVPLLPESFAVSRAQVETPGSARGILVRDHGVALAAERAGRYVVSLSVEGTLEPVGGGQRLILPLREIAGGSARITLRGPTKVTGATTWKVRRSGSVTTAEAALGGPGLELIVPAAEERRSASGALEEMDAVTVISLGGNGVGRMRLQASPPESGVLEVQLPPKSRAWKVFVGSTPLPSAALKETTLRIPLKAAAVVEIAWTFEMPPMGIRGRYRVELPKLPMPIRDARWSAYLPNGLTYSETQAALAPSGSCSEDDSDAFTRLQPEGVCTHYARAVLDSGRAWIEGNYAQAL